jgi:hypothetical protein
MGDRGLTREDGAMKKSRYLPIGEVSSATLRSEDVVPELFGLADTVRMSVNDRRAVRKLQAEWDALSPEDETGSDSEIWSELSDVLDSYAPPFCYVGSLEGDGACIGVWLSQDALDMSIADGEIWIDHGVGSEIVKSASYRLVVSDHGNQTLYDRQGREIWGVV